MTEAILLAAGMSERFGEANKLLLEMSNTSLIRYVYDQLEASDVDRIIVVLGQDADKVISELPIKISNSIFNESYEDGMGTSIRKGLTLLSPNCESFLICLSDMPLLLSEHYNELLTFYEEQKTRYPNLIVRPFRNGIPGNPVIFSGGYKELMMNHKILDGYNSFMKQQKSNIIPYQNSDSAFYTDIDTIEDYELISF